MTKSIVWLAIIAAVLGVGAKVRADDDVGDEDVGEYCGGGPPSVVDDAWEKMDDGDLPAAKSAIVSALQDGDVDPSERGRALALLAEAQMRLHQYPAAIRNYQRALSVDEESAGAEARVGLATALHFAGRNGEAVAQAQQYVVRSCQTDGRMDDPVSCYDADYLISLAASDATQMFEAMNAAAAIELSSPAYMATSFSQYVALVDPPQPTGTQVAVASTAAAL